MWEEENWTLLLGGGVAGSHIRNACGMENTVTTFGKYSLSLPKRVRPGDRKNVALVYLFFSN